MKKNLLLSVIILQAFIACAQKYEWVTNAITPSIGLGNYACPVAVDPVGNVYGMINTGTGGAIIQNDTISCLFSGAVGIVIAKFNPNGILIWAKMFNGNGAFSGSGEKLAVDNAGSVYASMNNQYSTTISTDTTYSNATQYQLVKLDSAGQFIRTLFYTNGVPRISVLGTDLFVGQGNFIEKLDSAFNQVWRINDATATLNFGYSGSYPTDIFVQTNGQLVASAYEWGNLVGPVPFGNDTVHFSPGNFDEAAIVKLDTSGNLLWSYTFPTTNNLQMRAVALDTLGNTYLTMYSVSYPIYFASDTLINTVNAAARYAALLKWDNAGTPQWGKGIYPGTDGIFVNDLAINGQGDILLSGSSSGTTITSIDNDTIFPYSSSWFIFKFLTNGNFAWYKSSSTIVGSYADGIAVRSGNEYITNALLSGGSPVVQLGCLQFANIARQNFLTFISEQPELYPVALFTYSVSNDTIYTFTDQSTNATSWHWDFGDGDSSNAQSPSHAFALGGNFTIVLTVYHGACSSTDMLQIIGVGINEINFVNSFSIYPNPTTGTLIIKTGIQMNDSEFKIYNSLGSEITFDMKETNSNASEKVIQLKDSSPGLYLISVNNDEQRFTKKFLVK